MPELSFPLRTHFGAAVKVLVRCAADPHPVAGPVVGYLDTGASVTVLEPGLLGSLGAEAVAAAGLHVLGRDEVSHHGVYEVELGFAPDAGPPLWVPIAALGGPVNPKGAAAALGRDFLAHFTLTYDGPGRRFRVRW